MVTACPSCGGRTIQGENGYRCLKSSCGWDASIVEADNTCSCGEVMAYQGLDSWGQPNYVCPACGNSAKL